MPLHLCTACCQVPPAHTNGEKYLRRLEPQACCARPSAGRHYDLPEIGLCCCASITHPSDMDQPPTGNALPYANRQRVVMLIRTWSAARLASRRASLGEDIELAANSQRLSDCASLLAADESG